MQANCFIVPYTALSLLSLIHTQTHTHSTICRNPHTDRNNNTPCIDPHHVTPTTTLTTFPDSTSVDPSPLLILSEFPGPVTTEYHFVSNYFTSIMPPNHHNDTRREEILVSLFHRGNCGSEKLSNLSKVIQLRNGIRI